MSRRRPAAQQVRLPQQRSGDATVLAVLAPEEPVTAVVRFAASAAQERGLPLEILMLTRGEHLGAACMILDAALQLARETVPRADVRVGTLDIGPDAAPAGRPQPHDLVVATRETWSLLQSSVDAGQLSPGPPVLL